MEKSRGLEEVGEGLTPFDCLSRSSHDQLSEEIKRGEEAGSIYLSSILQKRVFLHEADDLQAKSKGTKC